jgi:ribonuclease T2
VNRSPLAIALVILALGACRSGNSPMQPSTKPPGNPQPQTRAATAQFDFFILNLSWSPEFCHSHPTATECAQHATFILHGLWPQNSDGTYPENCSSAPGPADPSQYSDIFPDPYLLEHEWKTHGTCSGLSSDEYFSAARKAFRSVRIPPQLSNLNTQVSMRPDQIVGLFTAVNPQSPLPAWAVSCGHNYLTAVEECLDKTLQPIACGGLRSCRAGTVRIPPP